MSKEKESDKWQAPELTGGVVLKGRGDLPSVPGPHRSFSYSVHSFSRTGYQTVQTSDYVMNPASQEKQLVTITASQFNVKNLGVDKVSENIRKIESALRTLPYECRVLQCGEAFVIQTYLPKDTTTVEKFSFENKIIQILKHI